MPNYDGGHYFLSVLAPLSPHVVDSGDGPPRTCAQQVREVLATLPTAQQSPASERSSLNSPFARNRRTHFARFVVIEDAVYNGRNPTDAIVGTVLGDDPRVPQPVDKLSTAFLFFGADFDARDGSEEELRGYLTGLWKDMETELRAVFGHCIGFDRVRDGNGFADYILRCQVETTMPFNDYWSGPPPLKDANIKLWLAPAAVTAIVAALAILLWLLGNFGIHIGDWAWGWTAMAALAVTGGLLYWVYRRIMTQGAVPLPTAPDSDLPSVLKALYLQQRFTEFAMANQGVDNATLQAAFADFVKQHRPDDRDQPTQAPGIIRS